MKKTFLLITIAAGMIACDAPQKQAGNSTESTAPTESVGQSGVVDETSRPNIVQTAVKSKDHTTLVAAVKAAGLVDALSNAGPFTVFAPVNAAFDALPKGTVDELLKPEKKSDLSNILEYHTYVGSLGTTILQDGQEFEQVNGQKVKISKHGDKIMVNDAEILATISTSNGIIHVINKVLLPPAKK
ncbi:fasciclin [Solitalea longa]|uniref:Fasciclin n=1 Tax=Solitalea longa TaxID=2079460 RepID=A0A2S5A6G2_9SPHI|nr:fasciclin domain-containing protein [Solitalea longa]POY37909.1 fasciclin [Solitalea longa]